MKIYSAYLLFAALLLLTTACKPKPGAQAGSDLTGINEAERVMRSMIEAQNVVETIDARAKVRIESPSMNVGGTAFIKLKKDEWMWVSVKKFGFEAARALITPDSFHLINRLDNSWSSEPLSYLEERYKVPARFDLLQQVMIGNPIFMDRKLEVESDREQYHLFGQNSRWKSDYWVDRIDFGLERMQLGEISSGRSLDLRLSDFKPVGLKRDFSHKRAVYVEAPGSGSSSIELEFNRLNLNEPVEYRFDIPARFERQ